MRERGPVTEYKQATSGQAPVEWIGSDEGRHNNRSFTFDTKLVLRKRFLDTKYDFFFVKNLHMMVAQKRSLNTYQDIPEKLNIWPVLCWKSDNWSSVLNRDCAVLNLYPKADNKTAAAEAIFF